MKAKFLFVVIIALLAVIVVMPILAQSSGLFLGQETKMTKILCSVGYNCGVSAGVTDTLTFSPPAGAETVEIAAWCESTGNNEPDERASLDTPFGQYTCPDPGAPGQVVKMTTASGEIILSGPAQSLSLVATNIGSGYTNSLKVIVLVKWYGAAPTEVPTMTATQPAPTATHTGVPTEVPTEVPTDQPTGVPTEVPTQEPSLEPSASPTAPVAIGGECIVYPSISLPQGIIPWEKIRWTDGRSFGRDDGEYAVVNEKGELLLFYTGLTVKGSGLVIDFGTFTFVVWVNGESCGEVLEERNQTPEPTTTPCPTEGCELPNAEAPNEIGRRWQYDGAVFVEAYVPFQVNGVAASSRQYDGETRYYAYYLSPEDVVTGIEGIADYGPCSATIQEIMLTSNGNMIGIPKLPSMWPAIWVEWAREQGFCERYIWEVLLPLVKVIPTGGTVVIDLNDALLYCNQ